MILRSVGSVQICARGRLTRGAGRPRRFTRQAAKAAAILARLGGHAQREGTGGGRLARGAARPRRFIRQAAKAAAILARLGGHAQREGTSGGRLARYVGDGGMQKPSALQIASLTCKRIAAWRDF